MKKIAIVCTVIFAAAPLAFANIGSSGNDEVSIGVTSMPVKTSVKANVGVGVTATTTPAIMNVKGEMMGGDEAMMKGTMGEERERGMERAEMMADEHASFGLETAKMHINVRTLMREENEPGHGAGEAEVDIAAKVHSAADFEHFIAHKAKADAELTAVAVADGKVKVEHKMPAKFLGFIKTSVTARAEADAEGNVEVDYPWYHIFMKKHVSQASLQSEIARALAAKRKAMKEGIPAATIEAQVEAAFDAPNLFETLADILKGASAKAKADAEASVQ